MGHGHLDYFQKSPLGGRSYMKLGDHGTPNAHNRWFILLYYVWGPAWIDIHWNSIWLRVRSRMASHYTWGSVITPHDFGGVMGRHLDTSFWSLTISWSRLLARLWSSPKFTLKDVESANIKQPRTNFGGVTCGRGQPSRETFEPDRKLLPAPPNFEKNTALAYLKATWLQISYWGHFTFKVQNPIYMFTYVE